MIVLGLTGSIGMGKSTTAKLFAEAGAPVYDGDATVHQIYEGEAAPVIEAAFPGTTVDGKVDRTKLSARVVHDPAAMKQLEALVHPMLRAHHQAFLDDAERSGAPVAVVDVPLLFETGGEKRVDAVVVVTTSPETQRRRILSRDNMSEEKLDAILARQLPDAEKRKRADFIVDTSDGLDPVRARIRDILAEAARMPRAAALIRRALHSSFRLSPMREIVLDTETTGLDPLRGDRLVEVGCVEIFNRMPTGQTFHVYINPERDRPAEAFAVPGLSSEFLSDKPLFAHVVEEFLAFIADAPLVIHNASFDISFINAELERIKRPIISRERLVDTLLLARRKHPGVPTGLDDLCSRYAIDNSRRTKHGALLDAELLAEVYIDLIGARQSQLILAAESQDIRVAGVGEMPRRQREVPLAPRLTEADRAAHRDFVLTLGGKT